MTDSNSPPKKIRRVTLVTNAENQAPTCRPEIQQQLNSLQAATENMQQQLNVTQGQLKIVIEALAESKTVVGKLLRQHYEDVPIKNQFPIKTIENLRKLNVEICSGNKNRNIKTMVSILENGGVLKNFKYVLHDTVTMSFNVDGVHGKQSLKSLDNFYTALIDAVSLLKDNQGPPELQIRKAMQRQKKRQFKNKSVPKPEDN